MRGSLEGVLQNAAEGRIEAQVTVAKLIQEGLKASPQNSEPTLSDLDELWKTLATYGTVLELCHLGVAHMLLHSYAEDTLNRAKQLMNEADEDIPGAFEKVRDIFARVPNLNAGPPFEAFWSLRGKVLTRLQILSVIAAGLDK